MQKYSYFHRIKNFVLVSLDERELKKLYYTIGEVAKIFDVNASLIRFWEKEFDFNVSKKNKKGNRLFTVKNIQDFNKIYTLVKIKGYTLEGARKVLSENKANKTIPLPAVSPIGSDVLDRLQRVKEALLDLKSNG